MIKRTMAIIALISLMMSCSNEVTYDVRVINGTEQGIKIDYKSPTHRDGEIQNSLILGPGQDKVIISTRNIAKDAVSVCDSVATYLRASDLLMGRKASLEWCSDEIRLETVDIEQYQYVVEYKKEHFSRTRK